MKKALLVAVAALSACPGTLDHPERFTDGGGGGPTCPDVPTKIFLPTCATSACHGAMAKSGMLDLQSPMIGARLLGAKASGGPGLLIDPMMPDKSVIYTKLLNPPPFQSRMPQIGAPLDAATTECVRLWVHSVVAPDGGGT